MNTSDIIKTLELIPHPKEGGYFRRTYESDHSIKGDNKTRPLLSSIYYLLCDGNRVGFLHKNRSDILHYFHSGSRVEYIIVSPEGKLENFTLGNNLLNDEKPQLLVKGGYWKCSILPDGEYSLISEAVSPGFDFDDNELACSRFIKASFPTHWNALKRFIK